MNCLELFAGAGGAALGLEAAGFDHLALVERDPDACAVLRAAGLGPVVEADVRDLDTIQSVAGPSCDLLWSSWPCQPFSSAGLRMGAMDKRNGWPWTVAAIDRFQPTWFMGENVRGLLSHTSICPQPHPEPDRCPRCYFDATIMADLRARFAHVGWWLLDAADYGVPQHRRRVIVWAGPAPLTPPAPTHGPGMFTRPWVSMGEALGLSSGRVVAAGETGAEMPRQVSESAPTIGTKGTAYLLRPAPTVAAGSTGSACGQLSADADARLRIEAEFQPLTGRRRLTVEECSRLQDFPPGHPWEAARTKTSGYRCVGNAVPPTLARVVAEAVLR